MRPRFSLIIPFYDGFPYIEQCVESVLSQDFDAIEVIIVDDRDSTHSGDALDGLYEDNPHVKVIHREANGGTLMARRDGVLAATGEYIMFMDQDDALVPGALVAVDAELSAAPTDILHFGVNVIAESAAAEDAREGMAGFLTAPVRELSGDEILRYQFAQENGFDWQVHHKAYSAEVAKKAWILADAEGLSYADDLYANFVLCLVARSYRAIDDVLYEYHLGRGETLGEVYTLDNFKRWCDADSRAYEVTNEFVRQHQDEFPRTDYADRLADVRDLLVSHSMNEAFDNLPLDYRRTAIEYALDRWPADAVAGELWRCVRDRAYALLDTDDSLDASDILFRLISDAEEAEVGIGAVSSKRYKAMRDIAVAHVNDLERRADAAVDLPHTLIKKADYEAQDIRIFVTAHKDVDTFRGNILQPVQVGMAQPRKRLLWAYQDDEGDNIADLNAYFCELTTQYWAWKNVDAQYYGFCHYRRYFDFSPKKHVENACGEVMDGRINWASQARYRLHDDEIAAAIEGYDIVTTGIKDLRKFPERYASAYDHYRRAPYLKIQHLDRVIDILKADYPEYAEDADAYLSGHETCFCNMYVMRREYFQRYCAWMFPLLMKFAAEWDTSLLSQEALRTPGHLSERLFNIWLIHEKRVNPDLKHKQVQCVHFEHPEHYTSPKLAAANGKGKPVVPVVFAADNNYVPMVTTTAYSMLKNASPDYFYDVVILDTDFSEANKSTMLEFFSRFENASLRFAAVAGMVEEYGLQTSNEHISVETYYRFLIQKVLPDYEKVLYLDSDLIIEGDVSQLFETDLGDNLIGAVRDVDYLGNLNMNNGERLEYTEKVLEMKNPYDYFQAGVLVMNLKEMRKLYSFKQWLEYAAEPKYIYDDQDILNAHCQGRVTYIDNAWNVMNDCGGRIKNVFTFAPAKVYKDFLAAYANPKIVHYAGFEKPWKPGGCDMSTLYWSYARETPFYERLIDIYIGHAVAKAESAAVQLALDPHESAISEDNPLRGPIDKVLPMGTRRREVVKSAARFVQGKK
jgi:lipopolysaccharide biosynthesis glycosyltransferase/glycosyltransferase involved in cell wall biosynthesis